MQKLCCVCTRQQFSASLDYFVTSLPPYLHQFSTISGGNCITIAPENPPDGNQVAFELWKMDIKEYREKLKIFANFQAGLYSLVLGQCTDALQEHLKSHRDYEAANQDGIRLLVIIWSLIHTFEENRKLSDAIMDVKEKFYKFYHT